MGTRGLGPGREATGAHVTAVSSLGGLDASRSIWGHVMLVGHLGLTSEQ